MSKQPTLFDLPPAVESAPKPPRKQVWYYIVAIDKNGKRWVYMGGHDDGATDYLYEKHLKIHGGIYTPHLYKTLWGAKKTARERITDPYEIKVWTK